MKKSCNWKVVVLLIMFLCSGLYASSATISVDTSAVKPGPVLVDSTASALNVHWDDGAHHKWIASFGLDATKPIITSITVDGKIVIDRADPVYRGEVGKRKGGWDAFFDNPPAAAEGTRRFVHRFHPTAVTVTTVGNRVEVAFNGMELGIFKGSLKYVFYPGSALLQQVAVLSTKEPDTAYYYEAGLSMTAEQDRRPGLNMGSSITYYDDESKLQNITSPYGSERHTLKVHYRAVGAKMGAGSIIAFPAPHRYLFARDYTTNLGYAWYSAWRGKVGLGIQQPPDDNTQIYPWMNAPPKTEQEMGIFFLLSAAPADQALQQVLEYTHKDRFPHLNGYVTFSPHWHYAFTEQAVANGPAWIPPFKPELESIGVDAAMIMDFHIDGHPSDLGEVRLKELKTYFDVCRQQSDKKFLLIPAEEANVILGGHWSIVFPKPIFWMMDRKQGEALQTTVPGYGNVYHVHSSADVLTMIQNEKGFIYQTHPRTKGSTGYPDKILSTDYFRSPRYVGTGWKAMPSDLSSPRLGERAFKTLDDVNNLNLHKIMLGEVDVFQLSSTDELYAHMSINYVRLPTLPAYDHYGELLDAAVKADGFISTGEITLPSSSIHAGSKSEIVADAEVSSTFPLRIAEIVWGDGKETHHEIIDLQSTSQFDVHKYQWKVDASNWTWARLAVWDVAGDGAFTNPVWNKATSTH